MRLLFIFMLFISSLFAHKLHLFSYIQDGMVHVNSYFASGAPCKNCKVIVDNKEIGETDEHGDYIFKANKDRYIVSVEAVGGHKAEESIDNSLDLKAATENRDEEESGESIKKILGLVLIGFIFFILWKIKNRR